MPARRPRIAGNAHSAYLDLLPHLWKLWDWWWCVQRRLLNRATPVPEFLTGSVGGRIGILHNSSVAVQYRTTVGQRRTKFSRKPEKQT